MFKEEVENLKSLVCELEGEIEIGNNDGAEATLDFIISLCNSIAIQIVK